MSIKVVELFAGVGGFRLGLEGWKGKSASSKYKRKLNSIYEIVWSNQWEPSTNVQHASKIYEEKFGTENHSNIDISTIEIKNIPNHDLLVGGFPCQDYSVATSLVNSNGLIGKKGVLWWSIYKILKQKRQRPKYLLLENVDRLLKSPSKQRGRDFAVMLKSLDQLGYAIEWKVINAGEYGMPQRRKRIFFIGYHKSTNIYKEIKKSEKLEWLTFSSTISKAFASTFISSNPINKFELKKDLVDISENFNKTKKNSPFHNTGLMINGEVITLKTGSFYNKARTVLGDVLQNGEVTDSFYISDEDLIKWKYHKDSKKIKRTTSEGFEYDFSEGSMIFPDSKETPSRTIITAEGGKTPSRFKHVVETEKGFRRLTPVELERLNMFPDNHTLSDNISDVKRAFLMGNALVIGIVEKIGIELSKRI